jgi:hypothetical protein
MSTRICKPARNCKIVKTSASEQRKKTLEQALNLTLEAYQKQRILLRETQERLLLSQIAEQELRLKLDQIVALGNDFNWD